MAKICHVRNYVSRVFPNIDRMRQINADTQDIFTRVCLIVNRDYYFGNDKKKSTRSRYLIAIHFNEY